MFLCCITLFWLKHFCNSFRITVNSFYFYLFENIFKNLWFFLKDLKNCFSEYHSKISYSCIIYSMNLSLNLQTSIIRSKYVSIHPQLFNSYCGWVCLIYTIFFLSYWIYDLGNHNFIVHKCHKSSFHDKTKKNSNLKHYLQTEKYVNIWQTIFFLNFVNLLTRFLWWYFKKKLLWDFAKHCSFF